jgi:parallel beta-helix repeat protein
MRNEYHSVNAPRPSAGRWPLMVGISIGLLTWSLLASGLASAQSISINSCPVVISHPGSYLVTQDLACPTSAVAITITASAVVLNLGGHTVSGGTSDGIAVEAVSGVVILDGTIVGFGGHGLLLENTSGSVIVHLTATQNGGAGIAVTDHANANTLAENTCSNNAYGIVLANSATTNTITRNAVHSNANGGIVLSNATGNLLLVNVATGNTPVDLSDSSTTCYTNHWIFNTFGSANPPSCRH